MSHLIEMQNSIAIQNAIELHKNGNHLFFPVYEIVDGVKTHIKYDMFPPLPAGSIPRAADIPVSWFKYLSTNYYYSFWTFYYIGYGTSCFFYYGSNFLGGLVFLKVLINLREYM